MGSMMDTWEFLMWDHWTLGVPNVGPLDTCSSQYGEVERYVCMTPKMWTYYNGYMDPSYMY